MKTWSYGINSLYRTASLELQVGPWWIFLLERVVDWCCDRAPAIPLPDLNLRLRNPENIDLNDGRDRTTWQVWYGDFRQLFHCVVHMPLFNYCQGRIHSRFVDLDYDRVKEMFYEEDKEFWDDEQALTADQHDLKSEGRTNNE